MAFDRIASKVPVRVARVTLVMSVVEGNDGVLSYDDSAEIIVVMSDETPTNPSRVNKVIRKVSDHMTAAQKTGAKQLLDAMLAKARTEIL